MALKDSICGNMKRAGAGSRAVPAHDNSRGGVAESDKISIAALLSIHGNPVNSADYFATLN
jgi:hypothetical protein